MDGLWWHDTADGPFPPVLGLICCVIYVLCYFYVCGCLCTLHAVPLGARIGCQLQTHVGAGNQNPVPYEQSVLLLLSPVSSPGLCF